jgi:predicted O-methyltransferase YrrM
MHDRSGCDESVRFSQHRQEQYLNDTLQNLKQIGEEGKRAVIMRMTSLRAAQLIADESLDFVYIDALHDYVSTLQDIEAWWPKLKSGGLMAGHDYLHSITFYGDNVITVAPAVQKFASEHSRQEQVSIPDFTWYFRK